MAHDEFISIKALASRLGMDRSHARRYVIRLGYEFHKRRTPDSGGQLTLCVDARDADAIFATRGEQGFNASTVVSAPEVGVFYVIQLVPDLDLKRLKLGFTDSIEQRLSQHRTAAPTAKVLRTWPCRRAWELTAIEALTRENCSLVMNEVFECTDLEAIIDVGNRFFAMLPPPDRRIPLASSSPLLPSTQLRDDASQETPLRGA